MSSGTTCRAASCKDAPHFDTHLLAKAKEPDGVGLSPEATGPVHTAQPEKKKIKKIKGGIRWVRPRMPVEWKVNGKAGSISASHLAAGVVALG